MGKLRQNSEVTCPRSCNLSVAKPGIYFQKSRSQTSVPLKSLPTTTKQAIHATFFLPTAAVVLVTQRKWMIFPDWIPTFFGKKHLVLSKCCIMLFAEVFLLRHNTKKMVSPWQGDCTGSNKVESYFLQKTCCLAFFTRCSSFRFFCRACLLEMFSTCSEGNQPLSRSESFTPSIHPVVWGKAQHEAK